MKPSRKSTVLTLADFVEEQGMLAVQENEAAMQSYVYVAPLTDNEQDILRNANNRYNTRRNVRWKALAQAEEAVEEGENADLLRGIQLRAKNAAEYVDHYSKYGTDFAWNSLPDSEKTQLIRGYLLDGTGKEILEAVNHPYVRDDLGKNYLQTQNE